MDSIADWYASPSQSAFGCGSAAFNFSKVGFQQTIPQFALKVTKCTNCWPIVAILVLGVKYSQFLFLCVIRIPLPAR